MSNIAEEAQKLSPSAIISLFTLDTSNLGGPVLNFVMASELGGPVVFGGVTFMPLDIVFEGHETSGVGALPRPKIKLAAIDPLVQATINTYGDLNGCFVRRFRTYARFLDGQPDADPTAFFGPDIYQVEQKSSDTQTEVVWELSASIDQEGKMLPGRVVIRDTCTARYRVWDPVSGTFNYTKAQCPYTGSQSYDINDLPVAQALDVPSRRLSCCKKRFGNDQPLPFWGFPGVPRNVQ